nr:porin family protein [uncultured Capnocytophaga sp.]
MNKLNRILLLFTLHFSLFTFAQENNDDGMISTPQTATATDTEADLHYLEDQFYFGLTYDYLAGKANNVVQHNLSRGIHVGFIRDLPMNKARNVGFGVGIGYAYDLVYNNMVANKTVSGVNYEIVERFSDRNITRNFFETHSVEIPVEFRFRTSTPYSHKFWRVYTGARFAYIFSGRSLYTADGVSIAFQNSDIAHTFQVKPFIAFGYNALNFYVQYNLTPLLKDAKTTDGTSLKSNVLQLGLLFYIL